MLPFALFFVVTNFLDVATYLFCYLHIPCRDKHWNVATFFKLFSALTCHDKAMKCRDKVYAASLRIYFNVCRDRAPIVATFLLLCALSFVATKVKFVVTFSNFLP